VRVSQSHYNKEIRSALRSGNLGHRKRVRKNFTLFRKRTKFLNNRNFIGINLNFNFPQVLQKIDFSTILDHRIDDYKYVAFQFAQAITLIDGK
jgi:hypothetical protein